MKNQSGLLELLVALGFCSDHVWELFPYPEGPCCWLVDTSAGQRQEKLVADSYCS